MSALNKLSDTGRHLTVATSIRHEGHTTVDKTEYASYIEQIGETTTIIVQYCGNVVSKLDDELTKKRLIIAAANFGQNSLDAISLLKLTRVISDRNSRYLAILCYLCFGHPLKNGRYS